MRPLVNKTPVEMNKNFETAIEPYMHDLKKYCVSLEKSKWDGEDLMQKTLEKAFKGWQKNPRPMAKSYLFRIASNTWIDGYRKRKPEEDMRSDLSGLKHDEPRASDAIFKAMAILLSQLSAKQRSAILLVEGLGYTSKETADMLDVSEGSIKIALHRARKKLKQTNHDNTVFESDEDDTLPYVTALRSENPDTFVRLYRDEVQEPRMSSIMGERRSSIMHMFVSESQAQWASTSIVGGGTAYVLVAMPMQNGDTLFVPFYQLEISALLSRLEGLQKEVWPIAA